MSTTWYKLTAIRETKTYHNLQEIANWKSYGIKSMYNTLKEYLHSEHVCCVLVQWNDNQNCSRVAIYILKDNKPARIPLPDMIRSLCHKEYIS